MMGQLASRQSFRPGKDLLWPICYWATVAFIFAWAVWQRFKLPLDPIADPDTWGYLSPALRKLTGAEFGHSQGRNFLYPGFLYLDRKSTRLNSSHRCISYAVFCLKKKN